MRTDTTLADQPRHRPAGAARRVAASAAALAVAALAPATAAAAPAEPTADDVEAAVADIVDEKLGDEIPGAHVTVVDGDDVVLADGYGQTSVDGADDVDEETTAFRVGSVAKLVTWTAVLQGVEDGHLDLDADVNDYLEESAYDVPPHASGQPVTLRHLATHTPGFAPVANPGMVFTADEMTSLEDALVDADAARVRAPGRLPSYSNFGTLLAGHIVEEVYDTPFAEHVEDAVFAPLGMAHSTFAQPVGDDYPGDLTTPHTPTADGPTAIDPILINWRPAGSMVASAADMATLMRAFLGGGAVDGQRVLAAESTGTMLDETHYRPHPEAGGWRFGFSEYIAPDAGLIGHSGSTPGHTAMLALAPGEGIGVYAATNAGSGAAVEIVDAVLDTYGLLPDDNDPAAAAGGSGQRAGEVAGEYRVTVSPADGIAQALDAVTRFRVSEAGDGQVALSAGGQDLGVWAETSPYVFEEVDGTDALAFDVHDGTVVAAHQRSAPMAALQPVRWAESQIVVGGLFVGGLLALLVSLIARGVGWLRRRRARDGRAEPATERFSASWVAQRSGAALALTAWAMVALVIGGVAAGGQEALALEPMPVWLASAVLPPVVAALAAVTAVAALVAVAGEQRRRTRLHQIVVAGAGLALVWPLATLGLLVP